MNNQKRTSRAAYLLLAAGLVLTVFSGVLVQKAVDTYRELRMQSYTNEIEDYIHFRFQNYVNTLVQTAAFFSAIPSPERNVFNTYSAAYLKMENYPGLLGLGFCKILKSDEVAPYTEKIRRTGPADFKVWTTSANTSENAERCPVVYRTSVDKKDQRSLGYDVASDANRVGAMWTARDSGLPTATAMLNLMQDKLDGTETPHPKSFIIFTPVFKAGMPTENIPQRRAALLGFVYSPFKAELLFSSLFKKIAKPRFAVNFNIYDGESGNDKEKPRLIYAYADVLRPDRKASPLDVRRTISIAGRRWDLLLTPDEHFHRGVGRNLPALVMFFNLVLSVLMFWLKKSNEREKLSRQTAEKSVMIRDEFLSIASHELKTPLTPLSLQLEILKKGINDPTGRFTHERVTSSIDTCIRSVRRLCNLVEDMLDVSRISNGKLQFEMEPMNLSASLRDIAGRFGNEVAASGSTLTLDIEENIFGCWDQFRIEQVIVNLVSNAIKYGARNAINIQLRRGEGYAVLKVSDGGIGIDPADQARIFNRFERVNAVGNIKGLGLGLYIVKMIVIGHQGRIRVESLPGRGSSFIVELPLGESSPEKAEVPLEFHKTLATTPLTERQPG